jgi:signal peptidase
MDEEKKELVRYGVTFILLIALFYGGTFFLRRALGTENPMMVVISQSMVPSLGVGDFIFIQAIQNFDDVKTGGPPEGDILVFLRPGFDDEYIVHRVIEKTQRENKWVYTTKGDNNAFPDAIPVPESNVIGKVVNRIPIIGYFSLFIKTMKGFLLVAFYMIVSFFYDSILPKNIDIDNGKFNYFSILPLMVAVLVIFELYIDPGYAANIEYLALVAWYFGCLFLPLSVNDDDMGLMIWLYHLVIVMIPIACDIVWWTLEITPSQWWTLEGSTLPITWLLMEETPSFNRAYQRILLFLLPGTITFLFTLYAKRSKWNPIYSMSLKIRGLDPQEMQ